MTIVCFGCIINKMGYYANPPANSRAENRKENAKAMAAMTRKEAREEAFRLLFETEFRREEDPSAIFALSEENREVCENAYIRKVYFGVQEQLEQIDERIVRHSNGWKPSRISPVSRSAIRLCICEMRFMEDIRLAVSLNEAIELVKKYDDLKMKAFVNGLLNGIKNEIEAERQA